MYPYHAYYSLLKLNSDNVMGNGYNKLINGINTKSFLKYCKIQQIHFKRIIMKYIKSAPNTQYINVPWVRTGLGMGYMYHGCVLSLLPVPSNCTL